MQRCKTSIGTLPRAYHPDDQELKPVLILMTVPGIDVLSARVILSAIGRNMSRS
jgi:hypothetical protein